MISIDRVYQTILMFANSDIRGNIKPRDIRLAINDTVNDIYEGYFPELSRAINRQNRGLINSGLENIPSRIREKLLYYLIEDADLSYDTGYFILPDNYRYIDSARYNNADIEFCKSNKEFRLLINNPDTRPTVDYPICLQSGSQIKVAPTTIISNVKLSYLRKPFIANWTFTMFNGAEIFNPSAPDFRDIDMHPAEENNVILKTLNRIGINLKEQDLISITEGKLNKEFNEDNAV